MVRKPPTKSTSDHGLPATGAPPPHSSPLCCRNRWYGAGKYPTYVRFSLSRPHSKFPAQRDVVNLLSRRERDDETTGPILALILEDCARLKARTVRVAIPRRPRDVDVETDELTAIFGIALPGSRIVETELLSELGGQPVAARPWKASIDSRRHVCEGCERSVLHDDSSSIAG